MKAERFIYTIITILTLNGCIQEKFMENGTVEEGIPVTIRLNFGVEDGVTIMTKGLQTDLDESRVNSLRVIVFNSDEKVVTNHVFPTSKLTYTSGKTEGYVDVPTVTGSGMKIFGVANELANSDFTTSVDAISTIDDLMALPVIANDANLSIARGANFLMSGWFNNDGTKADLAASDVTITANTTQDYKYIYLSRLDAKVEFKFTVGSGIDKFTPLSYAVYNAPKQAYLCGYLTDGSERALGAGYPYGTNCFNTTAVNFDNATDANAFGFYILESNLASKNEATAFAHRDLKDKGTIADGTDSGAYDYNGGDWNGQWAYANTYSPYVQIMGRIEYGDKSSGFISANVTYNIHLGDFSEGNYNDFSTRRNTHYTYNVTVNGANDIVVEVEQKNERMPAVEGTVVVADGEIITVDSHYSSRLLEFTSGQITEDEAVELSWFISTPYSVGTPKDIDIANLDYKWVEFYPQVTNTGITASYTDYVAWYKSDIGNNGNRYYVEDLVNDLKLWYSEKEKSKWPDNETIYVTAFVNEFYYDNGTADSPTAGTGTEAQLAAMWKKVANADDRYMHILCKVNTSTDGSSTMMGSAYSIFQHSIQTIYNTDPNITDLKVAWGTEMINEEKTESIMALYGTDGVNGRLYGQIIADEESVGTAANNKTSYFNGRNNTALIWGDSQPWTNNSSSKVKESAYGPILRSVDANNTANPAVYACMTRNRDNDGDGKIGNSEIRWYLAAIDQYFGILIGEPGISKDAVMYPLNTYNNTDYHYLSSTASTYMYSSNALDAQKAGVNWNNGFSFWAEEAGATSPSDINWEPAQRHLLIRCLRNLGKDSDESGSIGNSIQMYSQFSTKETNGETIGVVTSKYLNPQSLRSKVFAEGEQYGIGDETSTNNRPHVEFFIAASNSSTTTYDALKTNIEDGNLDDVCPEGWRVPYAKELALMFALIPSDVSNSYDTTVFIDWSNPNGTSEGSEGTQWLSSTFSRFGYYGSQSTSFADRAAIICNGNGIMTINKRTDPAQVRCVKDNINYAPQTPVTTLNDGGSGI